MAVKIPGPFWPMSLFYFDDERIIDAGPDAALFDALACVWCKSHKKDGVIPKIRMLTVSPWHATDVAREAIRHLIEAGIWAEDAGGYRRRNWDKWNPTQEEAALINAQRIKRTRAATHQRAHSQENPKTDCEYCTSEGWNSGAPTTLTSTLTSTSTSPESESD